MANDPAQAGTAGAQARTLSPWRGLQLSRAAAGAASMRIVAPLLGRDAARDRVLDRLYGMHGLPEKIAQLIAMGVVSQPEARGVPRESARPPLGTARVASLLRDELGEGGAGRFQHLAAIGLPASLGQVHRAVLDDGSVVAVKVQYPDIRDAIETDLAAVGWLARPFGNLRRDFSLNAYHSELREMLIAETDYRAEAESLRRFGRRIQGWSSVSIPAPIEGLCTSRVLTMTWIDGEPVSACRTWPRHERAYAARQLLRFVLAGILEWREVYADVHPGNLRFRRTNGDPAIGILDFGCLRSIEGGTGDALSQIIGAAVHGRLGDFSSDDFTRLYAQAGFDFDRIEPMKERLRELTALLFEPFMSAAPFDPATWRLGERAASVLGPHRLSFRTAGPPALLAFIRAYYGLMQHLSALDAPVSWQEVYTMVCPRAPREASSPPPRHIDSPGVTTHLRIRVEERGQLKVDLTLRGHLAAELADLVPDGVMETVARRGIDLAVLSARAADSQFSPQHLFETRDGAKSVRVWLE